MTITDLISKLRVFRDKKSEMLLILCQEYLPFAHLINLNQNKVIFPKQDKEVSMSNIITDAFLSKLATIEFGYNGWLFAGGTHKSLTNHTILQTEKFGELYGNKFGKKIPLATGATTKFMEIVNHGYNKNGIFSITSTTNFPDINHKVNREIKYCFTASTFANMEIFLIHNAVAGVFFEGGIGTTYEAFSMLIERQRGSISKNTPIIFIKRDAEDHILYHVIQAMQNHGKIYPSDIEDLYSVNTAEEAIDVLSQYNIFSKEKDDNDIKHDFIREIFTISENRYL